MQGGKQVEGERRPSVEEFSRLIRGAFRVLLLLFLGLVLVEFGFVLKTGIGTLDFSLSIAGLALLAGANVVFLRSIAGQSEIIESIQKSGRVIPAILITLEAALAVLVAGIFHSIASGYGVPDETYNGWIGPAAEEILKAGGAVLLAVNYVELGPNASRRIVTWALFTGTVFGLMETVVNPGFPASLPTRLLTGIPLHGVWTAMIGLGSLAGIRLSPRWGLGGGSLAAYLVSWPFHALWNQSWNQPWRVSSGAALVSVGCWCILLLAVTIPSELSGRVFRGAHAHFPSLLSSIRNKKG